jgi:hypothetical protein
MKVPISTQALPNMKGAQIFPRSAWEGGRGYRGSTASLINQYPSTSYRQGALRDDGLLVEDFQMRVQSHARVCQQLNEGSELRLSDPSFRDRRSPRRRSRCVWRTAPPSAAGTLRCCSEMDWRKVQSLFPTVSCEVRPSVIAQRCIGAVGWRHNPESSEMTRYAKPRTLGLSTVCVERPVDNTPGVGSSA